MLQTVRRPPSFVARVTLLLCLFSQLEASAYVPHPFCPRYWRGVPKDSCNTADGDERLRSHRSTHKVPQCHIPSSVMITGTVVAYRHAISRRWPTPLALYGNRTRRHKKVQRRETQSTESQVACPSHPFIGGRHDCEAGCKKQKQCCARRRRAGLPTSLTHPSRDPRQHWFGGGIPWLTKVPSTNTRAGFMAVLLQYNQKGCGPAGLGW